MTQIYINKTYTKIGHKIFEELVPSVSPLLKKHIRLGHAGKEVYLKNLLVVLYCPSNKCMEGTFPAIARLQDSESLKRQ